MSRKRKENGWTLLFQIVTAIAFLSSFKPFLEKDTDKLILISVFYGAALGLLIVFGIYRKRKWFQGAKDLATLRAMTPSDFEEYTAQLFRELGYSSEVTGGKDDGGVDVVLRKDGKKTFAQCKRYSGDHSVNPHEVRDFYGGVADKIEKGEKTYFVTTGYFTKSASRACKERNIEAINGKKLLKLMKQVNLSVNLERKCPECGGKLVERNGKNGKFLGCSNYPTCHHSENIN